MTTRSCAMSAFGTVSSLMVKLVPGPDVTLCTMFAATNRFATFVVVTIAAGAVVLLPFPGSAITSTGLTVSIPLYSKNANVRNWAAGENVTVTVFAAAAVAMFLA